MGARTRPAEALPDPRGRARRAALAAFAAASAWLSLGALAVLPDGVTRVGALPPLWLLAALVAAGAAAGAVVRVRPSTLLPLLVTGVLWLAWLPIPLPAAALLWQGPMAIAVWTVALLGVVACAAAAAPPVRLLTDPRRAPVVAALVGTACAVAGAVAVAPQIPGGDEPHYLIITQSLLLDGDLQIENNHQRRDYLSYIESLPKPDYLRRGQNRQIYSVHAPGLSALVAPAFAIGGYPAVVVWIAALVGAGAALAWHAAWLIGRSAAAAWAGWAAVFFSASVFFHAFTVYPDGVGAALAMAAVWLLIRLEVNAAAVPPWMLAGTGTALALLPWLHSRFAIVAAGLGIAIVARLAARPRPWAAWTAFVAVPVASAIAWFGFFRIVYGTFSPAAPYGSAAQNDIGALAAGLPGLFVDQQFGLFANAPAFALALAGLVPLARRHRRLVVEWACTAVPYVLAVASFHMWWAGHSAPARFLTILLLPAAVPIAWLARPEARPWTRAAVGAAIVWGALVVVLRAADGGQLLYNARDGRDLLLAWLSPLVDLPLAAPSVHRDGAAAAVRDAAIWMAALGAAAAGLRLLTRRWRPAPGTLWTLTAGCAAVAAMAAATTVWAWRGDTAGVTPDRAQLALLRAWPPGRLPLVAQIWPPAGLSADRLLGRLALAQPPAAGALFSAPLVPPGEYEIEVVGEAPLAGTLEAFVGSSPGPLARVDLTGRPAGRTGLRLRLAALATTLTVRGDETARRHVTSVVLRPVALADRRAPAADAVARAAAGYGTARVFFLDRRPFVEVPGFWTAGAAATHLVVDLDADARPAMLLRAGAVRTVVTLTSGAWRAEYTLAADAIQEVRLPWTGAARPLTIATSAGFRPAEADPKSSDTRLLGVWVEFP